MHSIWVVATNTIKQALRMKVAAVFIVLLLVLLPVMGVSMTGDGTLKGRLQTFVSYGLSLTNLLLCLLTVIVSIYTLTNDIRQRQIYTVITKPVRRYQLLLGKLLGVVLLSTALLALFSAIIYAITIYTPVLEKPGLVILLCVTSLALFLCIIYTITLHISVFWKVFCLICLSLVLLLSFAGLIFIVINTTEFSQADLIQVENEFFTARASLVPPQVDVTEEVLDAYRKLEKGGQLPPDMPRREVMAELTRRIQLRKRAAVVGERLVWEFDNVKVLDPNETVFIRYKYDAAISPPDLVIYGRWDVGDIRLVPPVYESFSSRDPIRTFRELHVPASLIAEDGYLAVSFLNLQLNDTTVIFPPDGLELLYKADTFTANFIRAVLLIWLRLIFLAVLGLLTSTFLSFPVAILLSLCILLTATFSAFCLESFDYLGGNLSWIYSYTVRPMILLLPQFDKFNPTMFLVSARLLSWSLLVEAAGLMICIKASILLLLALLIFKFREIAKIII
jgi:ABC-type transport system involved in multi-copper enzyme maturation permease subunit